MPKKSAAPFVLSEALLSAFDTNDRINQYLLENLPGEAWRAEPPGKKGRDVAGIVAHMHNVRVMWLKATKGKVPEQLDRFTVTPAQAKKALAASRAALREVLQMALEADGRVKGFRPDVAGVVGYLHCARRPSSRTDHNARRPGGIRYLTKGDVRHVGVGRALRSKIKDQRQLKPLTNDYRRSPTSHA